MKTKQQPPKRGRKPIAEGGCRTGAITMPEALWLLASRLGQGNISAGIRAALLRKTEQEEDLHANRG